MVFGVGGGTRKGNGTKTRIARTETATEGNRAGTRTTLSIAQIESPKRTDWYLQNWETTRKNRTSLTSWFFYVFICIENRKEFERRINEVQLKYEDRLQTVREELTLRRNV